MFVINCRFYNSGELDAMRKSLAPLRQALQEQQQTRSEPTVDIAKSAQMQERLHKTEEQNARLLEVVETVREQLSQALKQIVQNEVCCKVDSPSVSLSLYWIFLFIETHRRLVRSAGMRTIDTRLEARRTGGKDATLWNSAGTHLPAERRTSYPAKPAGNRYE